MSQTNPELTLIIGSDVLCVMQGDYWLLWLNGMAANMFI